MNKRILQKITENLFGITLEQQDLVIKKNNGKVYIGKTVLSDDYVGALVDEATALEQSRVLKILVDELTTVAKKRIYNESKSEMDVLMGKAILYTMEQFVERLKKIKNLK